MSIETNDGEKGYRGPTKDEALTPMNDGQPNTSGRIDPEASFVGSTHTVEFIEATDLLPEAARTASVTGVLAYAEGFHNENIRIETDELIIGRGVGSQASLDDRYVSRRHVRITRHGEEFVLEDLNSSQGTFVDGVPIVSCSLRDGDAVQIGRTVFVFLRHYRWNRPTPEAAT